MFNVGTAELLVILLVALLVLGPNKLPDAARQVGRALGELRRLSSGFQAEMRDALREPVEGKPASGATTPVKNDGDGALSSPKPGDAGAETTATPPPVTDGSGTTGADVEHLPPSPSPSPSPPPSPPPTERNDDPVGGDGGTTTAPTGRGGAATSPPAPDAGANGSTPT